MNTTRPFNPGDFPVGAHQGHARFYQPRPWVQQAPFELPFTHPWRVSWLTDDSVRVADGLYHKLNHSNDQPLGDHIISLQGELSFSGSDITGIDANCWILLKVEYQRTEMINWVPLYSDEETPTGTNSKMFEVYWIPETLTLVKWETVLDEEVPESGDIPLNSTEVQYFKLAYVKFDIDVGAITQIEQKVFQAITLYPVLATLARGGWD